jgi:hypothetical protein
MTGTHRFRLFLRVQAAGIARRVMSYKRRGDFVSRLREGGGDRPHAEALGAISAFTRVFDA